MTTYEEQPHVSHQGSAVVIRKQFRDEDAKTTFEYTVQREITPVRRHQHHAGLPRTYTTTSNHRHGKGLETTLAVPAVSAFFIYVEFSIDVYVGARERISKAIDSTFHCECEMFRPGKRHFI